MLVRKAVPEKQDKEWTMRTFGYPFEHLESGRAAMSYKLTLLAPNLLRVDMYGYVDKKTAEVYYPETCQILDSCPKPTHILVDARQVKSTCPAAQRIVDRVKEHPNVGKIAFLVRHGYIILFAPLVTFLSGIRLFTKDEDAMVFLQPSYMCPLPTRPSPAGPSMSPSPSMVAAASVAEPHGGSIPPRIAGPSIPTRIAPILSPPKSVPMFPPPVLFPNPFTFFTDVVKGLTCDLDELPTSSES